MSVTTTVHAALVAALKNAAGGTNGATLGLLAVGSNSVHEIAGVFYVLATDFSNIPTIGESTSSHFQMYKSTDSGATWATVGAAFAPGACGGGMNSFVVGTKIWVSYSKAEMDTPDAILRLNYFETAGATWGAEQTYNLATATGFPTFKFEGPYSAHVRLDGSFVFIGTYVTSPSQIAVVTYDAGTFAGPFLWQDPATLPAPQAKGLFGSSLMRADGKIDVFLNTGFGPNTYSHFTFNTDNSHTTVTAVTPPSGAFNGYFDDGLEYGFASGSVLYLAVGKDTGVSGIYGQPAILWGSDAGWTMGALLDTDAALADYSMVTAAVFLFGSTLVYYWRGSKTLPDTTTDTHSIDRIGYAPVGSHNTPAAWTWATVYDSASPSPAVSGQSPTYKEAGYRATGQQIDGANTGVMRTASGLRVVSTLLNASDQLFVAYLFDLAVSAIVYRNTFE